MVMEGVTVNCRYNVGIVPDASFPEKKLSEQDQGLLWWLKAWDRCSPLGLKLEWLLMSTWELLVGCQSYRSCTCDRCSALAYHQELFLEEVMFMPSFQRGERWSWMFWMPTVG